MYYSPWYTFRWSYFSVDAMGYSPCSIFRWPCILSCQYHGLWSMVHFPLAILGGQYHGLYIVHGPSSVSHTIRLIPWLIPCPSSVGHTRWSIPWTIVRGTLSVCQSEVNTVDYSPWSTFHWPYLMVDTMDYSPWSTFLWPYLVIDTMDYSPWSTFH